MMKKIYLTGLLCLLLSAGYALSQSSSAGYRLAFQISDMKDSTLFLGFYYRGRTYVADTAQADNTGSFVFKKPQRLNKGFYFLMVNQTRLFNFAVGDNQHFKLSCAPPDYIASMKAQDIENERYFKGLTINGEAYKNAQRHIAVLNDTTKNETDYTAARKALTALNNSVADRQALIVKENPHTLAARIILANQDITVPPPPIGKDGRPDSTFQYRYYREHFFDHIDLSDSISVRMPKNYFEERVEAYLDKLHIPHPDTLIAAVEHVVGLTKENPDTYHYLIWLLTLKYQHSDIMGLDKVFVHIYDAYYATGKMDSWANESLIKSIKDIVDRTRLTLIGNTAPDLIMQDKDFRPQALYNLKNKYTIIYFFNPSCATCSVETPKLVKFQENTRFDAGVYAVCTDTSMQKMRDYIKKMNMHKFVTVNGPRSYVGSYQKHYDAFSTPTVIIIDRQRKVIAKRIPIEKIETFLSQHEELHARKSKL